MTTVAKVPRHVPRLAIAVLTGAVVAGAADGRDFVGIIDTRNVVDAGDNVVLTVAARVFNYGDAAVEGATVSLENPLDIEVPYGTYVITSLETQDSVRFDIEATVPRAEYDAWQAGMAPRVTIAYVDGDGEPVTRHVEIVAVRLDEE